MTLRVLVDENTSPRVVERLEDAGHEAVHVVEVLGEGTTDDEIVVYAAERKCAILTHDSDFLSPNYSERTRVLYYDDDTIGTDELARKAIRLGSAVRSNEDLAPVTYLGTW